MSRLFFYDSETTGLPLFSEPSNDPRQPHIVQFAGSLVDDETDTTIASIDLIAKPDGWTIPDDIAAIHGITTERAIEVGVDEALIVRLAFEIWKHADKRIGHNEQFDARMMRIVCFRFLDDACAETWGAGVSECTARMATPRCKMPPTAKMRGGFKTPKLSEAHEILLGAPLIGAHSALADVDGCRRIYRHMTTTPADALSA